MEHISSHFRVVRRYFTTSQFASSHRLGKTWFVFCAVCALYSALRFVNPRACVRPSVGVPLARAVGSHRPATDYHERPITHSSGFSSGHKRQTEAERRAIPRRRLYVISVSQPVRRTFGQRAGHGGGRGPAPTESATGKDTPQ
jgi:hypothetical protein